MLDKFLKYRNVKIMRHGSNAITIVSSKSVEKRCITLPLISKDARYFEVVDAQHPDLGKVYEVHLVEVSLGGSKQTSSILSFRDQEDAEALKSSLDCAYLRPVWRKARRVFQATAVVISIFVMLVLVDKVSTSVLQTQSQAQLSTSATAEEDLSSLSTEELMLRLSEAKKQEAQLSASTAIAPQQQPSQAEPTPVIAPPSVSPGDAVSGALMGK